MKSMSIQTVNGKIEKEDLGIVTPHEHIFINLCAFFEKKEIEHFQNPESTKIDITNLGILNRDPYALKDNLLIDDYETQKKEILRFKEAGGKTIVDATTIGIGRNPLLLRKIAEETGLNVICGAGFYVHSTHPNYLNIASVEEIAKKIEEEVTIGIDGTSVRAGVIGEIGISELFHANERKVLHAAAIAAVKTGAGVLVHINPWTENGVEAAEILLNSGVAPKKICISHVDVEGKEPYIQKLVNMGVYVEFDNFGKEYFVDLKARRPGYGLFMKDTERVALVKKLTDGGYDNQILLSCDVCLKTTLRRYGGWGYDHVLTNIVPMMEEIGLNKNVIDKMLIDNPADFLA